MAETLERVAAPKPSTPRSVFIFRFASTLVLWSIALGIIFSGYEIAFFALIGTLGLLSLWEFYGMLDHKGLPNFKVTAMICGAVMLCGSFYYFSKIGPGHSYDFEMAVLLFFLLTVFTRQMFERFARRCAAADDGLHDLWAALRALALQLHHENRLRGSAFVQRAR